MNLEKIIAVSGKPGLYTLKTKLRTGFVAESLIDGKNVTVNVILKNNASLLSEISIYTHEGEKPLSEVMHLIAVKENKGAAISHKEDNAALIAYFKEILPQYDQERVYPSNIKKILNWYNILQAKGLVTDLAPAVSEEETPVLEEAKKAEVVEEK